ncbi:tannase and feruloyl esterase-domain-containing protein [Boeremia exigua]|uniref:tannase and feruloyl esterase-domain-containing protein n=1 Tax=Boeremia exigua TaxID=749465 RepID=UPI001E8CCF9E|nr:tannase and feruloyl esterase-domain-containing protein [Boeremia exigua]KAH6613822.1 tannase and feruloyl esterase-domain-containing protein [Boeremia exigua]
MTNATSLAPSPCAAATFTTPGLFGANFTSLSANLVTNYSFPVPDGWRYSQPSIHVQDASFRNITVSYTHPGQNDTLYVETWLPDKNYNGRLQSIGGGGWVPGRFILTYGGMIGAWGILSPGNTNLYALQNLGSVSLKDESVSAKHFIQNYYGEQPKYSYWNACSQGGRQGSMIAQRYPDAYDGIIAAAPALHWSEVVLQSMWPAFYMANTNQFPNAYQLNGLTVLATEECDKYDGVEDGLITDPDACLRRFNATAHIGEVSKYNCTTYNGTQIIDAATVDVARALWSGPVSSTGKQFWYGYNIGTDLSSLAATNCNTLGKCSGNNYSITAVIDATFVAKGSPINITDDNVSHERFDHVYLSFKKQFDSLIGAVDPDYSEFKEAGDKTITYHGLADPSISPNGTLSFYKDISDTVPDTPSFYRYFSVPGLGHCWGGNGGQPVALFDQLRAWVENGTAPESTPVTITKPDQSKMQQLLCAWPKKAVFAEGCDVNGDVTTACWSCE